MTSDGRSRHADAPQGDRVRGDPASLPPMRPRCKWCGRFVSPTTKPWTFLNAYGDPVTQLHCPDCREHVRELAWRNLLYWPHGHPAPGQRRYVPGGIVPEPTVWASCTPDCDWLQTRKHTPACINAFF